MSRQIPLVHDNYAVLHEIIPAEKFVTLKSPEREDQRTFWLYQFIKKSLVEDYHSITPSWKDHVTLFVDRSKELSDCAKTGVSNNPISRNKYNDKGSLTPKQAAELGLLDLKDYTVLLWKCFVDCVEELHPARHFETFFDRVVKEKYGEKHYCTLLNKTSPRTNKQTKTPAANNREIQKMNTNIEVEREQINAWINHGLSAQIIERYYGSSVTSNPVSPKSKPVSSVTNSSAVAFYDANKQAISKLVRENLHLTGTEIMKEAGFQGDKIGDLVSTRLSAMKNRYKLLSLKK